MKMHKIIEGLDGAEVTVDSIRVHGTSRKQHEINLWATLTRFVDNSLKQDTNKM